MKMRTQLNDNIRILEARRESGNADSAGLAAGIMERPAQRL